MSAGTGDAFKRLVRLGDVVVYRYWEIDDAGIYRVGRTGWKSLRDPLGRLGEAPLEFEERERFRFYRLSREEKEELVKKLRRLVEAHGEAQLAILFGSFTRNVPFRDVDLAVHVKGVVDALDYKLRLDEEFSEKLKVPVNVKVLNDAPAWFALKVLREGRVLLEEAPLAFKRVYLEAPDEKEALERAK